MWIQGLQWECRRQVCWMPDLFNSIVARVVQILRPFHNAQWLALVKMSSNKGLLFKVFHEIDISSLLNLKYTVFDTFRYVLKLLKVYILYLQSILNKCMFSIECIFMRAKNCLPRVPPTGRSNFARVPHRSWRFPAKLESRESDWHKERLGLSLERKKSSYMRNHFGPSRRRSTI